MVGLSFAPAAEWASQTSQFHFCRAGCYRYNGEMASRWRFSIVRFSLRSLFLAITAICIVLGTQWEWVRQRRSFVDEQRDAVSANEEWALHLRQGGMDNEKQKRSVHYSLYYTEPRGPGLLWLVGERGVRRFELEVPATDPGISERNNIYTVPSSHPLLKRARQLFPEAKIFPVVRFSDHQIGATIEVAE